MAAMDIIILIVIAAMDTTIPIVIAATDITVPIVIAAMEVMGDTIDSIQYLLKTLYLFKYIL